MWLQRGGGRERMACRPAGVSTSTSSCRAGVVLQVCDMPFASEGSVETARDASKPLSDCWWDTRRAGDAYPELCTLCTQEHNMLHGALACSRRFIPCARVACRQ